MEIKIFKPTLPPPNVREILRYAGAVGDNSELSREVEALLPSLSRVISPAACYAELPVSVCGEEVAIGSLRVNSKSLSARMRGAGRAVLFAVTLGISLDREIMRLGAISPAKQLFADAFGAERIESGCDALCFELEKIYGEGRVLKRFSAGYGDVPLELQRDIFAILDCPRKIGLTLNESLLMSPSKSVTAIVGILDK